MWSLYQTCEDSIILLESESPWNVKYSEINYTSIVCPCFEWIKPIDIETNARLTISQTELESLEHCC